MWYSIEDQDAPEGETLLLTVVYSDGCTIEDVTTNERVVTIGFIEEGEWHIAGWDWEMGNICDAKAEVIAWAHRPKPYAE